MNIETSFTYQSLSCFKQRPSEKIRYLINRNLKQLINISIKQANQFTNTTSTKLKSLQQLKYTLLIGQQTITPFTEQILKSLVKTWQLDVENIDKLIFQIVQVIGYHVKSSYYIPLMLDMLQQQQFKNSNKNTIILLNLASHMFKNSQGLEQNIESLAKTLSYFQNVFYDNDQGLVAIFSITQTLVNKISKFQNALSVTTFFSIILNVLATKSIKQEVRLLATNSMQILAKKAGYNSVADLHANEIDPILTKIIKNKQYVNWTRTSKDRFKFDTIIRNCHSEVIRFLPQTLQILQFLINPQSDLQTRMDTLVLTQFMLTLNQLKQALQPLSEQIMKKLLIPSIQWKIGKPQIKIRKAGMINMTILIQNQIINEEQLLDCYKELFPHLKNCLNDDWAPQLRLASCQFLEKYLNATKQNIGTDQLRELYPLLLQRLDDSQDPIRKKITISINIFFTCRYVKLSESTLEYVVGAIFVHFDDTSQQIQDSIYISLRFAAKIDSDMVLKAAKINQKKMKNKTKCRELIQFCEQLIQEKNQ